MAEATQKYNIALGELLRQADIVSKTVISAYKPDASHLANRKLLGGRKFSADALEACAVFLKIKTRNNRDKIYSNKETLADRIILKIESFFEAECNECLEKYTNHLDAEDDPPFTCFLCLQGSHNCAEIKKIEAALKNSSLSADPSKGLTWLCKVCFDRNNLLTPTSGKRKESVSFEDTSEHITDSNDKEDGKSDTEELEGEEGAKVDYKDRKICKLYMQMKCPHGLTGKREIDGARCRHNHPPRCHRYCKFGSKHRLGCSKGKSCRYYHPVICKFSLRDRKCFNPDCSYTHLKGTARYDTEDREDTYNHPERTHRGYGNRNGHRQHTEGRQRTYSNASSVKDYVGSRKRTYSSTSANSETNPQTPTRRLKPSNMLAKSNGNDFLEKRFRLVEEQLDEIKRLMRPPNVMQAQWNPMLNDHRDPPYTMPPPLYPPHHSQMMNSNLIPSLWNQPLTQLQNNINSTC